MKPAARKSHLLLRAGAVGAVVQIARSWIRGDYAQGVAAVAEDALRLCRALEAPDEPRPIPSRASPARPSHARSDHE